MTVGSEAVYISQLQAQLEEYKEDYKKQKSKADHRYKYMSMIAEKICSSDYGKKQLGGKNKILALEDTELRDFIVNDYNKQRSEYILTIKELQKAYLTQHEEALNLAQQVLDLKGENKVLKDTIEMVKKMAAEQQVSPAQAPVASKPKKKKKQEVADQIDGEVPVLGEEPQFGEEPRLGEEDITAEVPTPTFEDVLAHAEKVSNDSNILIIKGVPVNVPEVAQTLNEIQKDVVYVIGHEGLSETSILVDWLQKEKKINPIKVNETLTFLSTPVDIDKEMPPLLVKEKASTPLCPNRYMFRLNQLGKAVYSEIYKKNPVKNELEKLTQQHASLLHGMCIRDTATELSCNSQFHDVKYFDKDNTFDVGGGERYVPDITARTDKGDLTFWEVELAHHNDMQFFNKLEKAIRVTNVLYIIAKDASAQKVLIRQVNRFISKKLQQRKPQEASSKRRKTIYFYIFTMRELANKKIFQEDKETSKNILRLK